jgi:hypothetical protein
MQRFKTQVWVLLEAGNLSVAGKSASYGRLRITELIHPNQRVLIHLAS